MPSNEAKSITIETAPRPTLLLFLKYPTPGKVKTRLAQTIGPETAATLYRSWITRVFEQLQALRGQVSIAACFTGEQLHAFSDWLGLADEWWPQSEGDLGSRLTTAFQQAHQRSGLVMAIGTDCLEFDATLIQTAVRVLGDRDAVFGPTSDGGYYLVGTSKSLPSFFDDIPWSDPSTLKSHLAACRNHGWSYGLLPQLRDIDTWEDWQAFQSERA